MSSNYNAQRGCIMKIDRTQHKYCFSCHAFKDFYFDWAMWYCPTCKKSYSEGMRTWTKMEDTNNG